MTTMQQFQLRLFQERFLNINAESFIPRLPKNALTRALLQLSDITERAKQLPIAERSALTWNALEAAKRLRELCWDNEEIEPLYNFAQAINQPD